MRIRSENVERWLAPMAVFGLKVLFLVVRRRMHLASPVANPYIPAGQETFTYCVWHDSLIAPLFIGRQPSTMALVGGHRDGGFVASCLKWLGIPSARGSASKGGAQAARQLIEESRGYHLVLTPDGPRGPRREMKPGCAFLAAHTGKPVVPTAFVCTRAWYLGTGWTDLMIPKPFSTIHVVTAPGITVPAGASREELQEYTQLIQREMDRINQVALELARPKRHAANEPQTCEEPPDDEDLCR